MKPHVRSLRRLLLLLVSAVILVTWAVAAALSYQQARHEIQELMDGQLAQSGALLLAQATRATDHLGELASEMAIMRGVRKRRSELTLEFMVGFADGTLLAKSLHAPTRPLNDQLGYADIEHAGERWRTLILSTDSGSFRILVAQSIRLRDKEALEIAAKTVLPLILFAPVLIGLIFFSVRRGLKPLDDLAGQVAARTAENLQPLNTISVPSEVRPLVDALNRLLSRLSQTLENERRFTADAAHELRTPLAAIRIQAQVAMAGREADERDHALQQVVAGTDRATRLVEQLLRLARLDPLAHLPAPQTLNLVSLAKQTVARAGELASQCRTDLHFSASASSLPLRGDADLLEVALRNLIDNALRYSPMGSAIKVIASLDHGETVLSVKDAGPGVAADELPKLIERFYRGREATAEGSGLGLAIVRRIAELHGAHLEIANLDSGGFMAQLRWPVNGCQNDKGTNTAGTRTS